MGVAQLLSGTFGAGEEGLEESEWEESSVSRPLSRPLPLEPLDEVEKETLWRLLFLPDNFGLCHKNFCLSEPGVGVAEPGESTTIGVVGVGVAAIRG